MSNQLTKEMRDAILMEDLGWLGDLTIHRVGGKLMLGEAQLPFSVSHVMTEPEFVRKWLIQFAVGNDVGNGRNYFDLDTWMSFTENGTRAVMIVTDEEKPRPLMVIQPLLSTNMTQHDHDILRRASILIRNSAENTMTKTNPSANLGVAGRINEVLSNVKPRTFTDMVLPEFYERHFIIPRVEKQLYYIRDSIREGQTTDNAEINRAREILYRDHKGESNTKADHDFINYLSQHRYEFKTEPSEVTGPSLGSAVTTQAPVSFDPNEC